MRKRTVYKSVLDEKNDKAISILIGSRQVGKTTIIKELHRELGGLFLDLDVFSNYEKVSTYENFLQTLTSEGYEKKQKKMFFVFMDEFQRFADLTMLMKNVYDNHDNIKIYATGSSSLTIKNNIQESLAGRKYITYVYPLSFPEFLVFKNEQKTLDKLKRLKDIKSNNYHKLIPEAFLLFEEFLIFGGYPAVALAPTTEFKKRELRAVLDLYISKDLVDYLKVEKIKNCKTLIEILAVNNGAETNYSKYGVESLLNTRTIMNYMEILKETFLVNILRPYFSNKNKEISTAPKVYFMDNGVRNYFCNNFNPPAKRGDIGALFEAYCIGELLKAGVDAENLKYYRTKTGVEVDIILDRVSEIFPIECKYTKSLNSRDTKGLRHFMKEYSHSLGYLINLGTIGETKEGIKNIDCFNFGVFSELL